MINMPRTGDVEIRGWRRVMGIHCLEDLDFGTCPIVRLLGFGVLSQRLYEQSF